MLVWFHCFYQQILITLCDFLLATFMVNWLAVWVLHDFSRYIKHFATNQAWIGVFLWHLLCLYRITVLLVFFLPKLSYIYLIYIVYVLVYLSLVITFVAFSSNRALNLIKIFLMAFMPLQFSSIVSKLDTVYWGTPSYLLLFITLVAFFVY